MNFVTEGTTLTALCLIYEHLAKELDQDSLDQGAALNHVGYAIRLLGGKLPAPASERPIRSTTQGA